MSVQVALRLPEQVVELIDRTVTSGAAKNRTEFIESAIERDLRRRIALHDADVLRSAGTDSDLESLAVWAANNTVPLENELSHA
ncbi:MAG: ribbon-helix-helix domain-containing protein [Actinomycetaceae bacterium]|nr:ribbon-helix-helix domain-containing protein [Actinomycetaceae bacterium]MDY6082515.1 ribbon-helix-helix domain-containing protein [Actinomycetaceae bacterium]